jgi:dolichol-phosphate mannosyltransferase
MEISLSVVIPVYNEAQSVVALLQEIIAAIPHSNYEIIFVDDASDDRSVSLLLGCLAQCAHLKVLKHEQRCGQSTAMYHGVCVAKAQWIVTLDGDGQNDPSDIETLLMARERHPDIAMFCGWRQRRQDSWLRRQSSMVANKVRQFMLNDHTPDIGCGLKLFRRYVFLSLPHFDHMHRFLPTLVQRSGGKVLSIPVMHRPRRFGRSKYGVWNRLWSGLLDMLGVWWLMRRCVDTKWKLYPMQKDESN